MRPQHQTQFKSYFLAESYLEIQGYHCEREKWISEEKPNATVVAKPHGVKIEFEETKH